GWTQPRAPMAVVKIHDIVRTVIAYGDLSDAQANYLRVLLDRLEAAKPVPAVDGRTHVIGRVLSVKVVPGFAMDETSIKIVVQHQDGWKLYGTLPRNLLAQRDTIAGSTIEFDAAIQP